MHPGGLSELQRAAHIVNSTINVCERIFSRSCNPKHQNAFSRHQVFAEYIVYLFVLCLNLHHTPVEVCVHASFELVSLLANYRNKCINI